MTLGEQLSLLRRNSGMTQQELGDKLSISPQAVSKWENDLSEPDVATLKKIAMLYGITLAKLLDFDSVEAESNVSEEATESSPTRVTDEDVERISDRVATSIRTEAESASRIIGHCVQCGLNVTEESVGVTTPRLLCRDCVEANARVAEERERAEAEAKERAEIEKKARIEKEKKDKENRHNAAKSAIRRSRNISLIVSAIFAVIFLVFALIGGAGSEGGMDMPYIITSVIISYCIFSFVSAMFYEGPVRDLLFFFFTRSISFPGLIFSFDIDGILWLIGMKILFAVLGFLAGVVFAIIGIILSLIIAPFVFPVRLIKINRYIRRGDLEGFMAEYE